MKVFITYKPIEVSTAQGYAVAVTKVYSSFDKSEMDELEKYLSENIKSGLSFDAQINHNFVNELNEHITI